MYGCKAVKKKKIEKDSSKVEVPVIFVKGNYFGTPLYSMCWINEGSDSENKGRSWGGGGGGADTRRKGLKEDFM
jgi:hypothetical protein